MPTYTITVEGSDGCSGEAAIVADSPSTALLSFGICVHLVVQGLPIADAQELGATLGADFTRALVVAALPSTGN